MCKYINPVECIIPPHINKHIAEKGSPEQRKKARNAMAGSARLRAERAVFTEMKDLIQPVAVAGKHRNVYTANNGPDLPGVLVRAEGDAPTGHHA